MVSTGCSGAQFLAVYGVSQLSITPVPEYHHFLLVSVRHHMHVAHRHTFRKNTHTHVIKMSKGEKKLKMGRVTQTEALK